MTVSKPGPPGPTRRAARSPGCGRAQPPLQSSGGRLHPRGWRGRRGCIGIRASCAGGGGGRWAPPGPGSAGVVLAAAASRPPRSFPGPGCCACLCACVCARARVGPDTHVPPTHACSYSLAGAAAEPWLPRMRSEPTRHPHGGTAARVRARKTRLPKGRKQGGRPVSRSSPSCLESERGSGQASRFHVKHPAEEAPGLDWRPGWETRLGYLHPLRRGLPAAGRARHRPVGTEIGGAQRSPPAPTPKSAGAGEAGAPPRAPPTAAHAGRPVSAAWETQWRRLGSSSLREPPREPPPARRPASSPAAPAPSPAPRSGCGSNRQSLTDNSARRGGEAGALRRPSPGIRPGRRGDAEVTGVKGEPPLGRESPRCCTATGTPLPNKKKPQFPFATSCLMWHL